MLQSSLQASLINASMTRHSGPDQRPPNSHRADGCMAPMLTKKGPWSERQCQTSLHDAFMPLLATAHVRSASDCPVAAAIQCPYCWTSTWPIALSMHALFQSVNLRCGLGECPHRYWQQTGSLLMISEADSACWKRRHPPSPSCSPWMRMVSRATQHNAQPLRGLSCPGASF